MKTLVTVYHPSLKHTIFTPAALSLLDNLSQVDWVPEGLTYQGPSLESNIADYDAVLSGWGSPRLTRAILETAERLKFIGHTAGTVVPFVDPYAFERGICVVNANKALARSTAEFCLGLILNAAWRIPYMSTLLREGGWVDNERDTVPGLEKRTVGLIGYGEISRLMVSFLKPFHVEILMFSHYMTDDEAALLGVEKCALPSLLQRSDIVSLHSTLTPQTRGLIGAEELSLLPQGALLINTARGPLVDEAALIAALQNGRLSAALDVYHDEPLRPDHPLLHLPNVLCTPHVGGFSHYWRRQLGLSVIEDMQRWLKQEPLRGQVTAETYARQTPR